MSAATPVRAGESENQLMTPTPARNERISLQRDTSRPFPASAVGEITTAFSQSIRANATVLAAAFYFSVFSVSIDNNNASRIVVNHQFWGNIGFYLNA
jgi:hypothetical protein